MQQRCESSSLDGENEVRATPSDSPHRTLLTAASDRIRTPYGKAIYPTWMRACGWCCRAQDHRIVGGRLLLLLLALLLVDAAWMRVVMMGGWNRAAQSLIADVMRAARANRGTSLVGPASLHAYETFRCDWVCSLAGTGLEVPCTACGVVRRSPPTCIEI